MNVLKSLAGTKSFGLKRATGDGKLEGFVDSDFAMGLDGHKSSPGFAFLSGALPILGVASCIGCSVY